VYSVTFRVVTGWTVAVGARAGEAVEAGDCCCVLEAAAAG